MSRLYIFKGEEDISDDVELKNSKGNPFGWSQHEVWYKNKMIGFLESGYPFEFDEDYKTIIKENENKK